MQRVAIFASGSGTNFQSIINNVKEGNLKIEVPLLICDKQNAYVLERAKKENVDAFFVNPKNYPSKKEYEEAILDILNKYKIDFIALAGYMRIIGETLLSKYEGKMINIHPALLPSFKGKDGIEQAFNYGVKVMGVTIHYVDSGMDSGKIIAQRSFDVTKEDTLETVEAKTHAIEHVLYPEVLKELLEDK